LRVTVRDGGSFSFEFASGTGGWEPVAGDFQASCGEWIGAKVGIYALASGAGKGHADFDYFRFGAVG
jgi:hypothetical protein